MSFDDFEHIDLPINGNDFHDFEDLLREKFPEPHLALLFLEAYKAYLMARCTVLTNMDPSLLKALPEMMTHTYDFMLVKFKKLAEDGTL